MPNHSFESASQHNPLDAEFSMKQNKWDAIFAEVRQYVDGIGGEMDIGILETVVAFNANGIQTRQSCEGHLDHGVAAPWVDIESTLPDDRLSQLEKRKSKMADAIWKRFDSKKGYKVTEAELQEMNRLYAEASELRRQIERPTLESLKKIITLLTEFYSNHQVPFDTQLTVQSFGQSLRIQSQGAGIQELESDENKALKLKQYQAEMNAFTAFLKNKYFS